MNCRDTLSKADVAAGMSVAAVSIDLHHRIEQFLFREARFLDHERWAEWLALMTDDIHYWMPAIENRRRADKLGAYGDRRGAYFDDSHADLSKRVARFLQPSAWAEDPPTRHVHVISNVEVFLDQTSSECVQYRVNSAFVNYRSRGEADNDFIMGRREDLLIEQDGDYKIRRRLVLITQSLLNSKNINTFF